MDSLPTTWLAAAIIRSSPSILQRAATSFEEGDYGFASEVLSELEAEGHLDHEIAMLRRQVDQAVRQTRIRQILGSARRFFEASEYPLALRKIQRALVFNPPVLLLAVPQKCQRRSE